MANSFNLQDVLPWGRNLAEYRAMFALDEIPPSLRILDAGGGPASFNAEMSAQGRFVVSADPLYQFSAEAIRQRIAETRDIMMEGLRKERDRFRWDFYSSPDALEASRMETMERFLADFPAGLAERRYVPAALPSLPFEDGSFDLALCSHMMFLYADVLDTAWHLAALAELMRLAHEARFYPLLDLNGRISPHVSAALEWAESQGLRADIRRSAFEFQKGADQMLVLRR